MTRIVFISLFLVAIGPVKAQKNELRNKIQQIASTVDGQVGVAIMDLSSKDTLVYNVHGIFPMQSVYKFPLALAVLKKIDEGKLSLAQKIKLTKKDLLPDTWSPLRDKYPNGGVEVSLEEILRYTVTVSDNNGCDILFRLLKGPKNVDKFIHSLGIQEIAIKNTEAEMHQNYDVQFDNWSKTRAMLQLLDVYYSKKILKPSSHNVLWQMLSETSVGPNRLKGLLPKETEVLHRTGTGPQNDKGVTGAVNDVGIIKLPNGKYFAIVVYLGRVKGEVPDLEKKIAEISLAVFESEWLKH
jgi:beta-lactamase class A